jgi:bifunctional non-homologous end joining protein LigD
MARGDTLKEYNRKRDFKRTAEPPGKARGSGGNSFVVQKHDATRLHWDFRLEADGVLKSWAVTKGPSDDPDIKRLAVRTEDHPLDYGGFEGTIPKGEYGGGTVMLWDTGTWEPIEGKSARDIDEGHLHFRLFGKRMKGEWLLVKMKPRPGEKRENWLLRKIDDEYANAGGELVERYITSSDTGRSMADIAAGKAARKKKPASAAEPPKPRIPAKTAKIRGGALPPFQAPQLATLTDDVPTGNDWMHEIKFDGYRAMISVAGDKVRVYTRTGQDWTEKFLPLSRSLAALGLPSCLIDGEIVAHDPKGNPDFATLQGVLKRGAGAQGEGDALAFYGFDLLQLEGRDLKRLGNLERKGLLEELLVDARPPIYFAEHIIGAGERLFGAICGAGQEGIVSKRVDASYVNRRARNWLKVKCIRREEFVIIGWKPSTARLRPFSSLLLAQDVDGQLAYRGKVGTGFNDRSYSDVAERLAKLEVTKPSVAVPREEARGANWVRPRLVALVAFAELTNEGRVRHGSFLGLAGDAGKKGKVPVLETANASAGAGAAKKIAISNRDRVIYPEAGLTKGQLADYYQAIAPAMLPFVGDRPISLVRCPQGRSSKCFFQKHDNGGLGPSVIKVPIREKKGGSEDYIAVRDADGLLSCVQMGTIEFHTWCSRAGNVEQPDRMVFDLDPDEGLDFADVKKAAQDLRRQLEDMGLITFVMLSGGKGVHIIVPLTAGHSWDEHAGFARRFALAMGEAEPDRFVATMSKAKRKGRIFIDWLRNQRGSTSVAPFSARAREGAPVAVPILWEELKSMKDAHSFSIRDVSKLIKRAEGKLHDWGVAEQALPRL